jgi:alpha-ketoglutarate-dependent taurine dioxygenase
MSKQPEEISYSLLKSVRRQAIDTSKKALIKTEFLSSAFDMPLVVKPNVEGLSLPAWTADNRDFIDSSLLKHGAILYRGFDIVSRESLEAFVESISLSLMYYMEGATPRTQLSDKIYTSTEYPSDQTIALHNELNYVLTWPMRIMFSCALPATEGGETPIADVRRVFNRLDPGITRKFEEKGWMLVRNFGDGLSLDWQTSFRMNTRDELEEYCRNSRIQCEWKDEERVRTRQVRPAVRKHPVTGEKLWFNHVAFWHISSLEPKVRELMTTVFKQEDLPYNTYYGDGSEIEESIVEEIRQAYRQETVAFLWQKGDLLFMDNMLVAHGRFPYKGPRSILVTMGEPYSDRDSWTPESIAQA